MAWLPLGGECAAAVSRGGEGGVGNGDCSRNFFGPADALHGNVRQELLQHGVSRFFGEIQASEDRSLDGAWRNRVDTNVAADEFRSQSTREGTQRSFGGGVDGRCGVTFDSGDAGVEDDGAAVVEVGKRFLNGVVSAFGVDVEN